MFDVNLRRDLTRILVLPRLRPKTGVFRSVSVKKVYTLEGSNMSDDRCYRVYIGR